MDDKKDLTYTVVKLDFNKKMKFRQLALSMGLTIQQLFNKLVDLSLSNKDLFRDPKKSKPKKTIREKEKLNEDEINELYDLFESED